MELKDVQPGDTVQRMLSGVVPMSLKVTALTDDKIICGPYEFDKKTGAEIDEDLGWGVNGTGSYIQCHAV